MSAEKYYVIDNMYQGRKFNIERFDNLNDAITSFNDVRAVRGQIGNMHRVSAIGVEKGVKAVDLLHDYDGFLIRINDTTEGINAKELADEIQAEEIIKEFERNFPDSYNSDIVENIFNHN